MYKIQTNRLTEKRALQKDKKISHRVTCEVSLLCGGLWATDAGWCDESNAGWGSVSALTLLSSKPHCFLTHKPIHSTLTAAHVKKMDCANYGRSGGAQHQINLGKIDLRGRWWTVLKILQKVLTHSVDTCVLQNRKRSKTKVADATADFALWK